MLVLALGLVSLILVVPLAALATVARITRAGLALAAALLACAAGWIWLMAGWAQPDLVTDTVLVLAILTPALIMTGRLADRVAVVRLGSPARLRLVAGRSLSALCVGLNVLVVLVVVVVGLYRGWYYTPPGSDALPLPRALTVVGDRNQGCSGGLLERCTREIDVTSAAGLSPDRTAQMVIDALNRLHGWRFSQYETGCRLEGWVFGREDVCVEVQPGQKAVQVLLDGGS